MSADRWITDLEVSLRHPVYTRANAGEVLPNPASPLGWTLVWEQAVLPGWRDSIIDVGTLTPDEVSADEVVGLFGGYLYINASVSRLFGVRAPGLSAELIDRTYFGDHPDVPPYMPEAWHHSDAATAALGAWMQRVLIEPLDVLLADQRLATSIRAERPALEQLTDHELVARARSFTPTLRALFERHLTVTAGASIGTGMLQQIAAALGAPDLALRMITSVGDVDSALPSAELWKLSRLPADAAEFDEAFAEFLAEYGSRGPNEWDVRSDVWETDPRLARDLIAVLRKQNDGGDPAQRIATAAADRDAATAVVRRTLSGQPEALAQFEMALGSAHRYLAGRERTKTNIVKVLHEVRMTVRELGRRHGYTGSQICMLLESELDEFVADNERFHGTLDQREREYLALFDLEPPFIVAGLVPPLREWAHRADPAVARAAAVATDDAADEADRARGGPVAEQRSRSRRVITGVAGCPGTVTGIARVIFDSADPLALEPGEILVAPHTDPSWTPLFITASAVVVDVGAQVSHAIIVSRELGLPCVVSATGATMRIRDGAKITVDGSAGTVVIHG